MQELVVGEERVKIRPGEWSHIYYMKIEGRFARELRNANIKTRKTKMEAFISTNLSVNYQEGTSGELMRGFSDAMESRVHS